MEFGIFGIGDVSRDPVGGGLPSEHERIAAITRIAVDAEQAGFDVFALGEHHNPPFVSSSQTTMLAYIAAKTQQILLSTSTTLITTNDPVAIAESFATLQHLASGRVDLMLGRGNTPAVYTWFGREVDDAAALTVENYALLRRLWREREVDWSGRFRAPLRGFTSVPRPYRDSPPPIWHGLTHSPGVAELAAGFGDGLFVNNLFMDVDFFAPYVELYRDAFARHGHGDRDEAIVGVGGALFVRPNSQDARREFRPYFEASPLGRGSSYGDAIERTGLTVGSPAEAIEKLGRFRQGFGDYRRQLFALDIAGLPEQTVREVIELVATDVLPALRRESDPVGAGSS